MLDKDNVLKIEFQETIGNIIIEKVALFNQQNTSVSEAREVIKSGMYSDDVLIMTKRQFENIFIKK